jgi:hypothetical protein
MIALAHEATPYGYVLINGNTPETAQLARLTGLGEPECEALLQELESNGVFSRTRQGTIYSRRMVRDEKRARKSRKVGKLGGNPTLLEQRDNLPQDNPQDKPEVIPKKPEARSQKEEEYIFQGKLVRLTQTDYDDWKRAYHTLDLPAELQRLDDYYHRNLAGANRPSWYERCSGALGKKHRELTQARKVDLPFAKVGMTDEEAAAVRERVLGQ